MEATQAKHTPGPWHRNIKPAKRYPVIFAGRNEHIAIIETRDKTNECAEANIELIRRAPDMFDALIKVQNAIADWRDGKGDDGGIEELKYLVVDPVIELARGGKQCK